jgi:hypothetical protein
MKFSSLLALKCKEKFNFRRRKNFFEISTALPSRKPIISANQGYLTGEKKKNYKNNTEYSATRCEIGFVGFE